MPLLQRPGWTIAVIRILNFVWIWEAVTELGMVEWGHRYAVGKLFQIFQSSATKHWQEVMRVSRQVKLCIVQSKDCPD